MLTLWEMTKLCLNVPVPNGASATAVLRTKHSHKGSKCPYMLLAPFADVQMPSLHEELPHIHWFILKDLV